MEGHFIGGYPAEGWLSYRYVDSMRKKVSQSKQSMCFLFFCSHYWQ